MSRSGFSDSSSLESSEAESRDSSSSSDFNGDVLRNRTSKRSRGELEKFYESYQTAFAKKQISLRAFFQDYPQSIRSAYSTAARYRAVKFQRPDAEPPIVGRPSELTHEMGMEVGFSHLSCACSLETSYIASSNPRTRVSLLNRLINWQ